MASDLADALQCAVMLEMMQVTEASMDAVLADRDVWMRCGSDIERLGARRSALTEAGQEAERDVLTAQIRQLHARADATDMGLIGASDRMMFGAKGGPRVFAALARSIAHMAHAPGGITAFGLHWCRSHNGIAVPYGQHFACPLEIAREEAG